MNHLLIILSKYNTMSHQIHKNEGKHTLTAGDRVLSEMNNISHELMNH